MATVAQFDFINRRIYLAVTKYNPIDIYREHRTLRAVNEQVRGFRPLVDMLGGQPKGGGESFPNALRLLNGAKIIPLDGTHGSTKALGSVVTDNPDVDADPYDVSGLTTAPRIDTELPATILKVQTKAALSSSEINEIANAVLSGMGNVSTGGGCGCASPDAVDIKTVKHCVIYHANASSIQAVSHGHIGIKQRTAQLIGTQKPNIIEVYP